MERRFVEYFGSNWIVVVFMVVTTFVIGFALANISPLLGPSRPNKAKSAPYESGVPDVKPARPQFTARFYVIGMLFVIFDLEAAFIYPWAVNFDVLGLGGFVHIMVFISLLLVSYVYAWKKGALEWV
jgi:NADH-quinone oxidoreductase subunit A